MRNVVVTGIPRAGTTLAAALIDSMPDTVCLSEPGWHQWSLLSQSSHYAKWLAGDFIELRKKLLAGEPVEDKRSLDGTAITNYHKVARHSQKPTSQYRIVPITRPGLSQDFTLAAKHNGPYLSALPAIVDLGWFTVIAIVRNPLDVIHSWRSLSLRVSHGEMPDAVPGWPDMAGLVKENLDLLEKQVKMYDLMCQRLYSLRDQIHIVRYEAMLRNPNLLREAIGVPGPMDLTLIGKPSRTLPDEVRTALLRALSAHGKHISHFYSAI
jgi:hypothetical protein